MASFPAYAGNNESDKETIISAQSMHSDQQAGIVTAVGKVEIARNGYILHADKVTYNQKTGVMHAEGHVAMLTPSGEVEFSESEDVTGDMKQGFAENIGILFPDNSRIAARTGQRYDGRYMVADTGVFTSCNVCKENPDNPPLWQLRAEKVVHDNVEHNIYYHDATLDFAGVPFFYTPYMSSPDPTVSRRQGFLTPMPGFSSTLGASIRAPYYFDIAPEKDATVTLGYSTVDGPMAGVDYRERFAQGDLEMSGMFVRADLLNDNNIDEGQQWRGYMNSKFVYDINNVWRAGSDINFASDKTILPRYNITSSNEMISRNYLEGFSGRDYAAINQYYFEDLRPGTTAVQPLVLPEASFSALGEPGAAFGGRWSLDGNTLVTTRDNSGQALWQQGPDTRRVAMNGGWERRLVDDYSGIVTTVSGLLHLDAYSADNVVDPSENGTIYNKVLMARQFEQANAVVSYPFSRRGDGYEQLVEPVAGFTLAPAFHNSVEQPIEESQNISFDETNLFSPNRFTGYDLIEGGSRFTYGMHHLITTDSGGRLDMFAGQSYDFETNSYFTDSTGLQDHVSDYVGSISASPADWINMSYSFRLDHTSFQPQQQYASVSAGVPLFRPFARYSSGYSLASDGMIENVDDATIGFDSHFAKYWLLHMDHTQGFDPQPDARSTNLTVGYGDECFIAAITGNENYTQIPGGIKPGTSVLFHIFLRNLGGFHSDSTSSAFFPAEFRQTD